MFIASQKFIRIKKHIFSEDKLFDPFYKTTVLLSFYYSIKYL